MGTPKESLYTVCTFKDALTTINLRHQSFLLPSASERVTSNIVMKSDSSSNSSDKCKFLELNMPPDGSGQEESSKSSMPQDGSS